MNTILLKYIMYVFVIFWITLNAFIIIYLISIDNIKFFLFNEHFKLMSHECNLHCIQLCSKYTIILLLLKSIFWKIIIIVGFVLNYWLTTLHVKFYSLFSFFFFSINDRSQRYIRTNTSNVLHEFNSILYCKLCTYCS